MPLLLLAAACGGGSSPQEQSGNINDQGEFVAGGRFDVKPDGSGLFKVDDSFGGKASTFRLLDMTFGRLVTVADYDDSGIVPVETIQFRDYLIGQGITTDGINYRIESNPVTQETTLTILRKNDPNDDDDAFDQLLEQAAATANVIVPRAPSDVPPYPLIARNSAIMLRFSDALDHDTVNSGTIRLLAGNPPTDPFEARIIPDPNHGALVEVGGVETFRSTRVIIDLTISSVDAENLEPPLTPNTLGLPPAPFANQANVVLKIPGRTHFPSGQFSQLMNVSRHGISTDSSFTGPVDLASPTRDVIRVMRSGGLEDENNGFLVDLRRPEIIGEQTITVTAAIPDTTPGSVERINFQLVMRYNFPECALTPRQGDIISTPGGFVEVVADAGEPLGGQVSGVRVRSLLEGGTTSTSLAGSGSILSTFDPLEEDPPECFVTFIPVPAIPPVTEVEPTASMRVRFSEPMDPGSIRAFDTFMVSSKSQDPLPREVVVGRVLESADLQTFTYSPVIPFPHKPGIGEQYFFSMGLGNTEAVDLAGNALDTVLPQVAFRLRDDAPSNQAQSYVLRFHQADEDNIVFAGNTTPEILGQFLYDFENGTIRPRSVSRFLALADRSQPVPSLMNNFPPGVQTPLSPLGSRLMTVWRHVDFNFGLRDETLYNVDVEGISWAPKNGQVLADSYEEFQISLAHSNRFPDEYLEMSSNLPRSPGSGLQRGEWDTTEELGNLLNDPLNVPMTVVYERQGGYQVTPADLFTADTGTKFLPFPLNEDVPPEDFRFYTWRDTAIQATGAPEGDGVDPRILESAQLSEDTIGDYPATTVPSIGLPLLMDFRCYPSDTGVGLNAFDVSLAVNSSGQPNFRLFATGGINVNQDEVVKNPDTEPRPTGGFNPSNGGKGTRGFDNVFYHGALDLIVRVSRVVTTWIDAGVAADWVDPVLEPAPDEQPGGTDILLEFRGATDVPLKIPIADARLVAKFYDIYGNPSLDPDDASLLQPLNDIDFFPLPKSDSSWREDIDLIDGARFAQIRMTFVGNTISSVTPELSALAVAFELL